LAVLVVSGLCGSAFVTSKGYCWQSSLAYYDANGKFAYTEDAEGNRIPDFSHAGYRGGGVELPEVPVKKIISPIPGDNTAHIQAAINEVAAMPPDADGFRGAVLLEAGEYIVNGTVTVTTSGVILRGVGDGTNPASNTILHRTNRNSLATVVSITSPAPGDNWRWPEKEMPGTRTDITTDWVKVGTNSFDVVSPFLYSVGDTIVIFHPATQAWIDAVDGGGTANDPNWSPSDSAVHMTDIAYFRYITAISGSTITIHAPVFNHLRKSLSQSYIYKFNRSGLIMEMGLESLRVLIDTNGPEATEHAKFGVVFAAVENGWIDSVTVLHAQSNHFRFEQSFQVTCKNCQALEPHSPISGGYRANFCSEASEFLLVRDCLATYGRHCFVVNGAGKDSGNVFLDCLGIRPYATSEGHRRWTNGNLWDNVAFIQVNYKMDTLLLGNRGSWGTSHGWSTVNSVAWNCDAEDGHIHIEQPPTAQNFGIGCWGNSVSGYGPFGHPPGFIEGTNQSGLEPRSLYLAQLYSRLPGIGVLRGDFNRDGKTTFEDFYYLAQYWSQDKSLVDSAPPPLGYDTVNFKDLGVFVDNWLTATKIPPLPGKASNPSPADSAIGISTTTDLSWTVGFDATSHDVYFGTSSPPEFQGNQTDTIFDPGKMGSGITYYWRIDSVNGWGITTRTVWSFRTTGGGPG
jgi:hypothetical protein